MFAAFAFCTIATIFIYLLILTLWLTWFPVVPGADAPPDAPRLTTIDFSRGAGVDFIMIGFLMGPFAIGYFLANLFAAPIGLACLVALAAMGAYLAAWCVWDQSRRGQPGQFYIWNYWVQRDGGVRYLVGWFCTAAIPLFFLVRLCGIVVYPVLIWSWGLKPLHARDYIQLSRYKWKGLVGADLLYCVYCEWMTGVWSLGTAQLQNIETMWCPLRFASEGHCDQCVAHFPDIDAWARKEEGMTGVREFYREYYDARQLGEREAVCQRPGAIEAARARTATSKKKPLARAVPDSAPTQSAEPSAKSNPSAKSTESTESTSSPKSGASSAPAPAKRPKKKKGALGRSLGARPAKGSSVGQSSDNKPKK